LAFWNGGASVYDYDPDTNIVTTISQYTANAPAGGTAENFGQTFGRWQYSPNIHAFTLNDGGHNVDQKVFRLHTF
jgi:hypothetical protein